MSTATDDSTTTRGSELESAFKEPMTLDPARTTDLVDLAEHPDRPPPSVLAAVALMAAATLGMQVALTRLFSFLYWHHFAFMIIAIGLLGFGAAGSWLARSEERFTTPTAAGVFAGGAALACTFAVLEYLLMGPYVRFAPLSIGDEPAQIVWLLLLYLLVLLPFLSLGLAQGSLLSAWRASAHRIYAADLLGAGAGCLIALAVLSVLSARETLLACGGASAASASLLWWASQRRGLAVGAVVVAACAAAAIASGWVSSLPLIPAPSKEMEAAFFDLEGDLREEPLLDLTLSSATIRLDIGPVSYIPFTFGGSIAVPDERRIVPTRFVFQDASAPTLLQSIRNPRRLSFLGRTSQSLAYRIRDSPRVAVIGAGGGPDVQIALHHGASSVTAVELNPEMLSLGRDIFRDFVHGLYARPNVEPIAAEGRHFLGRTDQHFDVLQMSGVDTFAALVTGAHAMAESYLYTLEAARAILQVLEPDGLHTNSRHLLDPPRETLRLVATMRDALLLDGADDPGDHLFVMSAGPWATTLVSRRPFLEAELVTLRAWVDELGWQVLLDPNGSGKEPFQMAIHAAHAERQRYFASYPYDVDPVRDDAPFFFQYYRWGHLMTARASDGPYEITALPVGVLVLVASLVQLTLLSALLIGAPLWGRRSALRAQPHRGAHLVFFAALGLGFMALEIPSIQMFTVFLGHPIYSMAVTLASLLIFSGLGAMLAGRSLAAPATVVGRAVTGIALWAVVTTVALQPLLELVLGWPLPLRALVTALWLAPAALCAGAPLPTAVRALANDHPAFVPWAWGTNACFSVLGSLGAVLIAMQTGFRVTLLLGAAVYLAGYAVWRRVPQARAISQPLS